VAKNAKFAKKYKFSYPLLCDTERTVGLAYGACDTVSQRSAKRIGIVIGPDGRVRSYHPKVVASEWPWKVLAEL
jgi:peroxiredoxin Q/BCP